MTHTSVNKNRQLPAYRVGEPPNNTLSSRQPSKLTKFSIFNKIHKNYDQNATSLSSVNKSHEFCSLFHTNSLNLPRWSPGYSRKEAKVCYCTTTQRSRPNKQFFSQRQRRLLLPSTPESNAGLLPINKTLDLSTTV